MSKSKEKVLDILNRKEEFEIDSIERWLQAKIVLQFILLREQKQLSQARIAEKMNVKRQQISKFENMENSPTIHFLVKYAYILETELDVLLKGVFLLDVGIK